MMLVVLVAVVYDVGRARALVGEGRERRTDIRGGEVSIEDSMFFPNGVLRNNPEYAGTCQG